MKTSSLIISMFIFAGLSVGLLSYYNDFVTPYSNAGLTAPPVTATFYSSTNMNQLSDIVNSISIELKNISGKNINLGTAIIGMGVLFLKIIWFLVQIPALIINVVVDLLNISWVLIPIPQWFISMVSVIITVYVVFRLASTVMGGRDL